MLNTKFDWSCGLIAELVHDNETEITFNLALLQEFIFNQNICLNLVAWLLVSLLIMPSSARHCFGYLECAQCSTKPSTLLCFFVS